MIFIALTVRFCAGNLLFIPYSYMYFSLDLNILQIENEKKSKILRGVDRASF